MVIKEINENIDLIDHIPDDVACQKKLAKARKRYYTPSGKGAVKLSIRSISKDPIIVQVLLKPYLLWTILDNQTMVELDMPVGGELFIMKALQDKIYQITYEGVVLEEGKLYSHGKKLPSHIKAEDGKGEFFDAIKEKKFKKVNYLVLFVSDDKLRKISPYRRHKKRRKHKKPRIYV